MGGSNPREDTSNAMTVRMFQQNVFVLHRYSNGIDRLLRFDAIDKPSTWEIETDFIPLAKLILVCRADSLTNFTALLSNRADHDSPNDYPYRLQIGPSWMESCVVNVLMH